MFATPQRKSPHRGGRSPGTASVLTSFRWVPRGGIRNGHAGGGELGTRPPRRAAYVRIAATQSRGTDATSQSRLKQRAAVLHLREQFRGKVTAYLQRRHSKGRRLSERLAKIIIRDLSTRELERGFNGLVVRGRRSGGVPLVAVHDAPRGSARRAPPSRARVWMSSLLRPPNGFARSAWSRGRRRTAATQLAGEPVSLPRGVRPAPPALPAARGAPSACAADLISRARAPAPTGGDAAGEALVDGRNGAEEESSAGPSNRADAPASAMDRDQHPKDAAEQVWAKVNRFQEERAVRGKASRTHRPCLGLILRLQLERERREREKAEAARRRYREALAQQMREKEERAKAQRQEANKDATTVQQQVVEWQQEEARKKEEQRRKLEAEKEMRVHGPAFPPCNRGGEVAHPLPLCPGTCAAQAKGGAGSAPAGGAAPQAGGGAAAAAAAPAGGGGRGGATARAHAPCEGGA